MLAAVVAACDDPVAPGLRPTNTDTLLVFAVTGSSLSSQTAINIGEGTLVRAAGDFGFDVAFDINAAGNAVLIPVRVYGGSFTSQKTVGLQKARGTFESVTRAPESGYNYDSTLVLAPGETAVVETVTDACAFDFLKVMYAKIGLIAVDVPSRRLRIQVTVDPNCGYRSFSPGVPKN